MKRALLLLPFALAAPAPAAAQLLLCMIEEQRGATHAVFEQHYLDADRPFGSPIQILHSEQDGVIAATGWYGVYPGLDAPFAPPPSFFIRFDVPVHPLHGRVVLTAPEMAPIRLAFGGQDRATGATVAWIDATRAETIRALLEVSDWTVVVTDRDRVVRHSRSIHVPMTMAELRGIWESQSARMRELGRAPDAHCQRNHDAELW